MKCAFTFSSNVVCYVPLVAEDVSLSIIKNTIYMEVPNLLGINLY